MLNKIIDWLFKNLFDYEVAIDPSFILFIQTYLLGTYYGASVCAGHTWCKMSVLENCVD